MSKMIKLIVVAAVLFGGSATASFLLKPAKEDVEEEQPAEDEAEGDAVKKPSKDETITAPYRSQGVTAETVLRLSDSIRNREHELVARETAVTKREEQLRFMQEDLKREKQEIVAMLELAEKSAVQSRAMLEEAQNLEANRSGGDAGVDPASSQTVSTSTPQDEGDEENLETIANWLQAMPPEQAADSIRLMCNDGKMDTVVRVLVYLEERNVAKILGALQDPALVADILERFRLLKKKIEGQ